MNLSPRNKLILVAGGCFIGVVLLVVVLVLPSFRKIGVLNAETSTAQLESDSARLLLEQRRQVKDRAAVTSARLVQLGVAVPETPDIPGLVIDLHDTAYESGVVLRSVMPGLATQEDDALFMTVPIQAEVQGTWVDTVDFLQRLNKLTRQVRVETFRVSVLQEPSAEELEATGLTYPPYYQVQTTVTLMAYAIPAESVTASESAPAPAPAPAATE